jgi:hypothetical protein
MFSVTALDRSFSNRIASLRKLPQHFIAAEKQCFHTVCLSCATDLTAITALAGRSGTRSVHKPVVNYTLPIAFGKRALDKMS